MVDFYSSIIHPPKPDFPSVNSAFWHREVAEGFHEGGDLFIMFSQTRIQFSQSGRQRLVIHHHWSQLDECSNHYYSHFLDAGGNCVLLAQAEDFGLCVFCGNEVSEIMNNFSYRFGGFGITKTQCISVS